jgi:hypothetical protein
MIRVISWNVLHIVHEINYAFDNSIVLQKYPLEKDRLNKIFIKINSLLDDNSIICLQECPYNLLNLLNLLVSNNKHNIEYHKYRRMPFIKDNKPSPYIDCSEYLVTIYPKEYSIIKKMSFDIENQSKGALILTFNNNLTIANVHVPIIASAYSPNNYRKTLFKTLLENIKDLNYIIIGDFNTKNYQLKRDMFFEKNIVIPEIDGYTRKAMKNNKLEHTKLDHIILHNIQYDCTFVDSEDDDLSDHKYIGIIMKNM